MWFPPWGCLGNRYSCFWEADRLLVLSQLLDANVFLSSSEARQSRGGGSNKQAGAPWPALLASLELLLLFHKATVLSLLPSAQLPSLSPHPCLLLLVSTARTFKGFQV